MSNHHLTTLFIQIALHLIQSKTKSSYKNLQVLASLYDCALLLFPSFILLLLHRPSNSCLEVFTLNCSLCLECLSPTNLYSTLSLFLHVFAQMPPFVATLSKMTPPNTIPIPLTIFSLSPSDILQILFNLFIVCPFLIKMKLKRTDILINYKLFFYPLLYTYCI